MREGLGMIAKLKDGYTVEINEEALDDWNFLKMLRDVDRGNGSAIVDVAEIFLGGPKEADRLAEHLKVDGKTSIVAMINAVQELMSSVQEGKNS